MNLDFGDVPAYLAILATAGYTWLSNRRQTRRDAERKVADATAEAKRTEREDAQARAQDEQNERLVQAVRETARRDVIREVVKEIEKTPADGVELSDEVMVELSTPTDINWQIVPANKSRSRYRLRNLGPATATGVRLDPVQIGGITRDLPEGVDLAPLESHLFTAVGTMQRPKAGEVAVWCDQYEGPQFAPMP